MIKPKILSFYLPQYHPIPENNEWWGEGFTDWRNVARGTPRFKGHIQPHIPADLGFYDLRLEETRIAQAELAKKFGIDGFCYYHYWFNGKMLLEKPLNDLIDSGKPDFPFCICWANENWSRRWDGSDQEILMEQRYEDYDAAEHFDYLKKAFSDTRYITVNGRPLFLIYNTNQIPGIKNVVAHWRQLAKENGFPDLYICSVKSIHNYLPDEEVMKFGFDALIEFIPNGETLKYQKKSTLPKFYFNLVIRKIAEKLGFKKFAKNYPITCVLDYDKISEHYMNLSPVNKTFPCVIPSWDNSARKKFAHVIQNEDADKFSKWLEKALKRVSKYPEEEQIVFINAWNEWAEGCHLEPDINNGKKFLEAVFNTINKNQ